MLFTSAASTERWLSQSGGRRFRLALLPRLSTPLIKSALKVLRYLSSWLDTVGYAGAAE